MCIIWVLIIASYMLGRQSSARYTQMNEWMNMLRDRQLSEPHFLQKWYFVIMQECPPCDSVFRRFFPVLTCEIKILPLTIYKEAGLGNTDKSLRLLWPSMQLRWISYWGDNFKRHCLLYPCDIHRWTQTQNLLLFAGHIWHPSINSNSKCLLFTRPLWPPTMNSSSELLLFTRPLWLPSINSSSEFVAVMEKSYTENADNLERN